MCLGHRVAQDGAHAAVDVGDIGAEANRTQVRTGIGRIGHKQRGVERLVELAVRGHLRQEVATVGARNMGTELAGRARQHGRQIEQIGLAVVRDLDLAQALGMADHLVDGAEAQARHDLAQLLGNEEHKVLNVLGLTAEATAQAAVLRGDAGRAGILLAVALHEAAHGDERHGRKAKLLGAQQAGDGNIGAVHELAVGLEHHAGAQAVLQQRLLGLGEAKLQRQTRMPDRVARRGTRAAVMTADQDLVGSTLGHTGGDGADAGLADQLDRHARAGVGVLKVKDQLCQVLDRVNIVVRRRRNQADAGRGLTDLGDPGVDLLTGQVTTLAGLGALGHLDLNLEGAAQVAARHAKARACYLLDRGVLGVAVGQRGLATRILAALARVGTAMQAVHGDSHALVRLFADGAIRHGAGVKAADDVERRLHLVERHRGAAAGIKVEQVAQAHGTAGAVQASAVLLKGVVAVLTAGGLQQVDSLRIDQVILAAERAPLGQAQCGQLIGSRTLKDGERGVVALVLLALNVLDTHTAHTAHRAGEVRVDELRRKAHGLEDLRRMVALHRGDAHLGHDGDDAGGRSLVVVGDALLGRHVQVAACRQITDARMCVVRIDAARGVAHQCRKVVRGHGVATLHHQVGKGTHAGADQVVVHAAHGEQRRHGYLARSGTIAQHHDVHAIAHRCLNVLCKLLERSLQRALAGIAAVHGTETAGLKAHAVDGADAVEFLLVEQRALQANQLAGRTGVLEQVAVVAQVECGRGDHVLAQGIDRRIRDLGEQLIEVVKERTRLLGQAGQRCVDAHRGERGLALLSHGTHDLVDVIPVVAELSHAHGGGHLGVLGGRCRNGLVERVDGQRLLGNPITVGLFLGVTGAQLVVVDHAAAGKVDLEHLARPQTAARQDVLGAHLDGAHLACQHKTTVARHIIAGGTQAITVEGGAQGTAIGKGDSGRTVPRLHEHGLVSVVGAALLTQTVVVVPRLGQQHGRGARERTTVHDQELKHIVQNRGIGALAVDDGHHALKIVLQHGAVQVGLAGANPVDVALEGVDLAVVDDKAVGVRTLPAGRGVGGVARVDERHGRLDGGVVEVDEEAAHLRGDQHALVHDGARTHGAHVEDLVAQGKLGVGLLFDGAAAHVQAAFEGVTRRRIVRTAQEGLQDGGHAGARRLAQVVRVDRHLTPKEQRHAVLGTAFLKHAAGILYALVVLWEEQHGHAIVALCRQNLAALLSLFAEKVMRNLEQDTGTVAGVLLESRATAVLQVDQNGQRVVQNLVMALAVDIGKRADATCIVVEFGAIKALLLSGICLHRDPPLDI